MDGLKLQERHTFTERYNPLLAEFMGGYDDHDRLVIADTIGWVCSVYPEFEDSIRGDIVNTEEL